MSFTNSRAASLVAQVALFLGLIGTAAGCRAPGKSSISEAVFFNNETINLDSYIANQADYAGMREEFRRMAIGNNGKPNYDDGAYKIQHTLKPTFSTVGDYKLVMEEQVAMLVWTVGNTKEVNPPYERINNALRSPTASDDQEIYYTVRTLASAINKLSGVRCSAIRGVDYLPAAYLDLQPGQKFIDKGFTAFAVGNALPAPFDKRPIRLIVSSPNCKQISQFSKYGSEQEALFPPGAEFEVTSNRREGNFQVIRLTHDGGPAPKAPEPPPPAAAVPAPDPAPDPAKDQAPAVVTAPVPGTPSIPAAPATPMTPATPAAPVTSSTPLPGTPATPVVSPYKIPPQHLEGKRYKNSANYTVWLNDRGNCTSKDPLKPVKQCKWVVEVPDTLALTYTDGTTERRYLVSTADSICFLGTSPCSPMGSYIP